MKLSISINIYHYDLKNYLKDNFKSFLPLKENEIFLVFSL